MKDIGQQRIDITILKMVMKPVQRVVKDVSKTISDSPLYHQALRGGGPAPYASSAPMSREQSLAPAFPAGLNTALAQNSRDNFGPPTSVPATPLTAALGPAAQATLERNEGYFPSAPTPGAGGWSQQQSQGSYLTARRGDFAR